MHQQSGMFIRAAANWETAINSPVTIFIDADFGPTDFNGDPWETGVLGSTSHPSLPPSGVPNRSQRAAGGQILRRRFKSTTHCLQIQSRQ
jgi:hypothetical protein